VPEKLPSWGTGGGLFVFFSKIKATNLVAGGGIEPPTQGFSRRKSEIHIN
jgi:hypothetical protein